MKSAVLLQHSTVLLCLPTGLVRLKWVETLGTLFLPLSLLLNSEFYCLSLLYSLHGPGIPSSPCPAFDVCAGVWRCGGVPVINLTAIEAWCSVCRALCSTSSTLCVSTVPERSFQQAHTLHIGGLRAECQRGFRKEKMETEMLHTLVNGYMCRKKYSRGCVSST